MARRLLGPLMGGMWQIRRSLTWFLQLFFHAIGRFVVPRQSV